MSAKRKVSSYRALRRKLADTEAVLFTERARNEKLEKKLADMTSLAIYRLDRLAKYEADARDEAARRMAAA